MITFSNVLDVSRAAVGVQANNKSSALEAASRLLCSGNKTLDAGLILEAITEREQLASTGVGEGVAVPHALLDGLEHTRMAVVRLERPVAFDAQDDIPVDLLFMLAGPKKGTSGHLQLLSKLARVLHDPTFRKDAREAGNGPELARLLLERD